MKKLKPKLYKGKWIVDHIGEDGKRTRPEFQTKKDAQDFCDRGNNMSARAFNIDEDLALEAIRCGEKLAGRMTLTEAVDYALQHAVNYNAAPTIEELVKRYLAAKETSNRPSTLKETRLKLELFSDYYGHRRLHEITGDDISEYAAEIKTDDPDIVKVTLDKYLAKVSQLFNYHLNEFCERNPVDKVRERLEIDEADKYRDILFFKPADCRKILTAADAVDARWYTVLGLFLGIRPTELERLTDDLIQLTPDRLIVRLSRKVTKIKRARVIEVKRGDVLGDCVLDWLDGLEVPQRVINGGGRRQRQALIDSVDKWIYDGLRHTAASMHVAQFQDTIKTAYLLGHEKPGTLNAHYRGLATEAEAAEFYALRPTLQPEASAA